jgi:AcrR family transcriptional regulator
LENLPSNRLRDRRRQATIDDVIAAAVELVHEEGLAGLSMRELGLRVGLHASSIYQYFPSKLDIYDALFAHGHRQLQEHMAGLDRSGEAEAVFRRGSAMFTEFCTADAVRYQLLFQRTIPGFVPSDASMALAWQSYQDMAGVLARLGVVAEADLDLWRAMQMGLTEQQIANDPGGQRWSAQLDRTITMFLGFVRGQPPRRKK